MAGGNDILKIGLLGGTFDPIHNGTLILCEKICDLFSLDKIYFVPCHEPPHKTRKDISHPFHRYAMVVLGTAAHLKFFPSFYEIEKGGKSYTIDTLTYFQNVVGKEHEIFFILGIDAFIEIESWKDYEKILESWNLIVLNRAGYNLSDVKNKFPRWISNKIEVIARKVEYPEPDSSSDSDSSTKIFFARTEPVPISASAIRGKAQGKESLHNLTPARIEMYIRKFNLYK